MDCLLCEPENPSPIQAPWAGPWTAAHSPKLEAELVDPWGLLTSRPTYLPGELQAYERPCPKYEECHPKLTSVLHMHIVPAHT